MSQSTGELIATALRRASPLIVLFVILGAGAVNLKRQLDGPVYSASAEVLLSTTDLGYIVAGLQPQWVDPDRVMQNALALARSPELYERVADEMGVSPGAVRGIVSVSGSSQADLVSFSAQSSDPRLAVEAVNAVADEFPSYRAEVTLVAVQEALTRLRAELATAADAQAPALREDVRKLELLETLTTGNAVTTRRADGAAKIAPNPVRDSMFGASIGLVFALLISGLRQVMDTRVWSEGDVETLLDAPIVASIPSLPKRAKLVTVGRYAERYGDAYALLAAHVMQLRKGEPLVVAITSATKEEGKSLTASNLAMALARRGARVVLADFDLRRPSIARIFDIPTPSVGVLQVLRERADVRRVLQGIPIKEDGGARAAGPNGHPGGRDRSAGGSLHVLPAGGTARENLSHLPRTPELISQLSQQADIVVIDTPPALATAEVADLSRLVDLVFVVARQGKAPRHSLRALARQAQTWQTEIGGVIVTDSESDDAYTYYAAQQR